VSRILGGLGNQMFQFAFGRALSLKHGVALKLDLSGFATYGLHRFELDRVFGLPLQVASGTDRRDLLGWRSSDLVLRILARPAFKRLRGRHLVIHDRGTDASNYFGSGASSYLFGYWQSEHYFRDYAASIRDDFVFRAPLVSANMDLARRMLDRDSVSVHIRRGDYVSDPKTRAVLGPCSVEYYLRAIDWLRTRVPGAEWFVFSDDVEWVKESIPLSGNVQYVSHNKGADSYFDMQLMSLCKHHIIANSTFSWWGAWLGEPSTNAIVVAPARWYADARYESHDLIPSSWVRL